MTPSLAGWLRRLAQALADGFWTLAGWGLDVFRDVGALSSLIIVLTVSGVLYAVARSMQRELIGRLKDKPQDPVALWQLELRASLPGLVIRPLFALGRAFGRLGDWLGRRRKRKTTGASPPTGAPPPAQPEPAGPPPDLLVATLGPSYVLAAWATAGLFLLGWALEPLLRARWGLSPGWSAWQFLMLGQRPETQLYLPLDRFPYLGGLLTWGFWLWVWWWLGRVTRLLLASSLGVNLIADRSSPGRLELWRRWLGAPELHAPAPSFVRWAKWLAFVGVPLLVPAWVSLGGQPYRALASAVALAHIGLLAWALLLVLRGHLHANTPSAPEEATEPPSEGPGWVAVLASLRQREGITAGRPAGAPQPVPELELSSAGSADAARVSPLLEELLPHPGRPTAMQQRVLADLSAALGPSVGAPEPDEELSLRGTAGPGPGGAQRPHHQVVLAPEGWGKTTLGLLAACNASLLHTRASLVVVRTPARAEELAARLRGVIEPSTLRWTLRVRLAGEDLVDDLALGIPPDIVVCSLASLVADLLDTPASYDLLLSRVGLVVIDDAESFCGPVEIHAQLALRRLLVRLRTSQGHSACDAHEAPQLLALACASMHDAGTWVRTLCGVDAQVRSFRPAAAPVAPSAAVSRPPAEGGGPAAAPQAAAPQTAAPTGRHLLQYRLQDFRRPTGRPLELLELVAECERLGVPWHYRVCGDGRRDAGRVALLLPEEPRVAVDDPVDACVVMLAGPLADIRREVARLPRAGAAFSRFGPSPPAATSEPIALVTVADPDEEVGLTQLDRSSGLAELVATLPRPILRAPTGQGLAAHLASELSEHWMEVAELVSVFGHGVSDLLGRLAQQDLLLAEPRTDLRAGTQRYEPLLYLRVPARALAPGGGAAAPDSSGLQAGLLPPKVSQVELASERSALLRDRTRLAALGRVDAQSASVVFYPGRIFADARGRFVVVQHVVAAEDGGDGELRIGEVHVEPLQATDCSSPRRRMEIRALQAGSAAVSVGPAGATAAAAAGTSRRLLGAHPVGVRSGPASVRCASHVATLRVDPIQGELRQCVLVDEELRPEAPAVALHTEALWLLPCPATSSDLPAGPGLTLGAARLLAAALRLVLPSVLRSGERELGLALQMSRDSADAQTPMGPDDALVFYDLQPGGSGASRSLERDGVQVLLRLARAVLERVVDTRRLRALHDEWADAPELLRQRAAGGGAAFGGPNSPGAAADASTALRREALTWLDSRLPPELEAPPAPSGPGAAAAGSEPGEGDPRDLGRCWYSGDGRTEDLVWTKHLWLLASEEPVTLDVGFDRGTAAEARLLTEHPGALAAYGRQLDELRALPSERLADGSERSRPRTLWLPPGPNSPEPRLTDAAWAEDPGVLGFQALAVALARHAWEPLGPLAETLAERCGARADSGAAERMRLARFLSRFVQGIPYSVPAALAAGLRPPVATLLYRLGDCDSKSLLLALLLQRCGIDAGLMVSVPDRHAVAAAVVALPDAAPAADGEPDAAPPADGELDAGPSAGTSPEPAWAALQGWATARGLTRPPSAWAALPPPVDHEPGAPHLLYVPLETTSYEEIGQVRLPRPETWTFVPLPHLPRVVALRPEISPEDRSEQEGGAP